MGTRATLGRKQPKPEMLLTDTLERLILENIELRQTAADLVLQTALLRESLAETMVTRTCLGGSNS